MIASGPSSAIVVARLLFSVMGYRGMSSATEATNASCTSFAKESANV
jgi:hypothetical protein